MATQIEISFTGFTIMKKYYLRQIKTLKLIEISHFILLTRNFILKIICYLSEIQI